MNLNQLNELDELVKTNMNPEMKLNRDMQDIIKNKIVIFNDNTLNDIISQYTITHNKKTKFINRYNVVSKEYRKSIKSNKISVDKPKMINITMPESENNQVNIKTKRTVRKDVIDDTEIITVVDTIIKTTIIKKPLIKEINDINYRLSEFCRQKLITTYNGGVINRSYLCNVFQYWYKEKYDTRDIENSDLEDMIVNYLTKLGYTINGDAVYNIYIKSNYSILNDDFFDFKNYK